MVLILAFSIGLALVLIGLGLPWFKEFVSLLGVISYPALASMLRWLVQWWYPGGNRVCTVSALNSLNFFSAVSHALR